MIRKMDRLYDYFALKIFPLYIDNGCSEYHAKESQLKSINLFKNKISSKFYGVKNNNCICGINNNSDILLSERDRHGIYSKYVVCKSCGLIRLSEVLDEESMSLFYSADYNNIYKSGNISIEAVFKKALPRGKRYFNLIKKLNLINNIDSVFESGACTGANLYPFFKKGISVQGCDYDEQYLKFGISKGLKLYSGDIDNSITKKHTVDLVISSHVLEHVVNPEEYIYSLLDIVKPGGYLLIEVPSLFYLGYGCNKVVDDLVNAHIYYYHEKFLIYFFNRMNLKVIYSDDKCTFVVKKPNDWRGGDNSKITIKDNDLKAWYYDTIRTLIIKYFFEVVKYKAVCKFIEKIISYLRYRYIRFQGRYG